MSAPAILRFAAERLSRNVILRRKLPSDLGFLPIYVTPDARLKLWSLDLEKVEPMLLRIARKFVKPGHVVWDIGANVGLFSFAAAAVAGPAGRVLAVDADARLCALLRRSSGLPNRQRAVVDVLCSAVSSQSGVAEFAIASRCRASNHLSPAGNSQAGGFREKQLVPTLTLDTLAHTYPAPNVLKIDVEGAESDVLDGAMTILRDFRPVLICEVGAKSASHVTDLLRVHKYRIFDADTYNETPRELPAATWNTLALPETDCIEKNCNGVR